MPSHNIQKNADRNAYWIKNVTILHAAYMEEMQITQSVVSLMIAYLYVLMTVLEYNSLQSIS